MKKMAVIMTCVGCCLGLWQTADAQETGQWGMGAFVDYARPTLGLADRWSGVPKGGITLTYTANPRISVEMEYHYSMFGDGSLETTPFTWAVDKRDYVSPNAVHEMRINSFLLNTLIHFQDRNRNTGFSSYFAIGTGLYAYRTKVQNLIFPGQAVEPLNQSLHLPEQSDVRTALGVNVGLGGTLPVGTQLALDVRTRYNVIFGYLRPHLAWGIAQTSFFQMLDLGVGLKYYF